MLSLLKRLGLTYSLGGSRAVIRQRPPFAEFVVRYGSLEVGRLVNDEHGWSFTYSEAFRSQNRVRTLADFPDKQKVYRRSGGLWPFFAARLPSMEQPQVQRIIKREKLDADDTAALLSRFGRHSISNPFVMVPAQARSNPQ